MLPARDYRYRDRRIIFELGKPAETGLPHVWEMLKLQGHGEEGNLMVKYRSNAFYVPDANGIHRAVSCTWLGPERFSHPGWIIGAVVIDDPSVSDWSEGSRVIVTETW